MAKIKETALFTVIHEYFKVYLPNVKKYSPHTIRAYRKSMEMLLDYVKEQKKLPLAKLTFEMIDKEMVLAFLDYLETERKCVPSTRNHRLHCIRAFYAYAAETDMTAVMYAAKICKIDDCKVAEKCVGYMTKTAVDAIIRQPDLKTLMGLRDMFLMFMLYQTGARVQEILNIRLRDLQLCKHPIVTLFGKNSKVRSVPLRDVCVSQLKGFLKTFHSSAPMNSDTFLFYVERNGIRKRMSEDNVRRFVANYGKQAREICMEVPEKVHPHLFRHTRAMHLYQNGVDLTLVSQWLGHSKLETTLIYASADTEHKRKAIEKAIPQESPMAEFANSNRYTIDDDELTKVLYGLK